MSVSPVARQATGDKQHETSNFLLPVACGLLLFLRESTIRDHISVMVIVRDGECCQGQRLKRRAGPRQRPGEVLERWSKRALRRRLICERIVYERQLAGRQLSEQGALDAKFRAAI